MYNSLCLFNSSSVYAFFRGEGGVQYFIIPFPLPPNGSANDFPFQFSFVLHRIHFLKISLTSTLPLCQCIHAYIFFSFLTRVSFHDVQYINRTEMERRYKISLIYVITPLCVGYCVKKKKNNSTSVSHNSVQIDLICMQELRENNIKKEKKPSYMQLPIGTLMIFNTLSLIHVG